MDYTIIGGKPDKAITFSEVEINEIIAMFDEDDRYAVEREMEKRARERRPEENINIHIISLDPLHIISCVGTVEEGWWEI